MSTFISKGISLRLVITPASEINYPNGARDVIAERVIQFENQGLYDLVLPLRDGDVQVAYEIPEPGRLDTTDEALADWLRAHYEHGSQFHEITPVAPDPSLVLVEVAKAAAAGDFTLLDALREAEAESWNRDQVLETIDAALESLTAAVAAAESEAR